MSSGDPFKTGGGLDELKAVLDGTDEPLVGQTIGNYRIEELIAEGGMGRVYRAARDDGQFDREVAIKILPPGMGREHIKRFEQEQRILASLTHPNIAQLYDAGFSESSGLFLVMELIDGMPIDEYARQQGLSTKAKTELMLQLTEALAFAHSKLVVHRDLKPSNVFVRTDGDLKLLDFGISKILESPNDVTVGSRPMTPRYASPEQLLNEPVSVASDIYQLGLLFLSLYTRRPELPDDTLESAVERVIKDTPLTTSSQIIEKLPLELTAIINKCLRIESDKRYASATELAADLRNYLDGYPVSARNPGTLQRGFKFAKRNLVATSAITMTVIALVVFLAISVRQQAATESARQQAERERTRAEETTDFLVELFDANKPSENLGEELSARDILDRGLAQLDELQQQPALKADLLETLAGVFNNIGDFDKALELITASLQIKEEIYADEPQEIASTLNLLSRLYVWYGRYEEALPIAQRALDIRRAKFGDDHADTLSSLGAVGYALQRLGRTSEAEVALQAVVDGRKEVFGEYHEKVTTAINNLAILYGETGNTDRSLELLGQVVERNEKELPAEHPAVAMDWYNYGYSLGLAGRYDESIAAFQRSIDIRLKVQGEEHPFVAIGMYVMSNMQDAAGMHRIATATMHEAYEHAKKTFIRPHIELIMIEAALGNVEATFGDQQYAEELLRAAYAQQVELFGEDSEDARLIMSKIGVLRVAQDRPAEALAILEPLAARKDEDDRLYRTQSVLVQAYTRLGEMEKAEATIATGEQAIIEVNAQNHPRGGDAYLAFAMAYLAMDRLGDAENSLQQAITANARLGPGHWKHQVTAALGGIVTVRQGIVVDGKAQLSAALQALESLLPATHVYVIFARDNLESLQSAHSGGLD